MPITPALRQSLVVALVAALALALLIVAGPAGHRTGARAASPATSLVSSYTPTTGATFNRPIGTKDERRRIFTRVNSTIDAVPAGGTIRMAVFSFSEGATVDALLRAKQRGVQVQVIIDDHHIFAAEARLRQALGKNPDAGSFIVYCSHACRRSGGDMHDKMFMFSKAGSASYVTMVGSDNLTSFNSDHQWADAYTLVNDPGVYFTYAGVFDQMKTKQPISAPYFDMMVDGYRSQFFPAPGLYRSTDPVMKAYDLVSCTATGGTGVDGHTLLRISMHAWFGTRGLYIANKVAALRRQGCVVQVIPGISIGSGVRDILTKAGVKFATVRHHSALTHQKVLTISGGFAGTSNSQVVFTGSHNYTDRALQCDDVMMRISSAAAYAQYAANFDDIWKNG